MSRTREFLFDPALFYSHPAFIRMSPAARGAYIALYCAAWSMAEPGVIPEDDDVLCLLARVDKPSWLAVKDQVAMAFEVRPGCWTHPGLVEANERQEAYFAQAAQAGRIGGVRSGISRRRVASRVPSTPPSRVPSTPPSRVPSQRRVASTPLEAVSKLVSKKEDSSDSYATSVSDSPPPQVNPVRKRTQLNGDPGPEFWNDPQTQDELRRIGNDDACRQLILANARAQGRL